VCEIGRLEIGDGRLEMGRWEMGRWGDGEMGGGGVVSGMGMGMGIFCGETGGFVELRYEYPCGGRRMGFR